MTNINTEKYTSADIDIIMRLKNTILTTSRERKEVISVNVVYLRGALHLWLPYRRDQCEILTAWEDPTNQGD